MSTSVRQMLKAADAVVPKITPDQASDMIKKGNALVVDVRDAPEVVAASGMIAMAVLQPFFVNQYTVTNCTVCIAASY